MALRCAGHFHGAGRSSCSDGQYPRTLSSGGLGMAREANEQAFSVMTDAAGLLTLQELMFGQGFVDSWKCCVRSHAGRSAVNIPSGRRVFWWRYRTGKLCPKRGFLDPSHEWVLVPTDVRQRFGNKYVGLRKSYCKSVSFIPQREAHDRPTPHKQSRRLSTS